MGIEDRGEPRSFDINWSGPHIRAYPTSRLKYKSFEEAKADFRAWLLEQAHLYLGVVRLLDRVRTWDQYDRLTDHGMAGPADPNHEAWKVLHEDLDRPMMDEEGVGR